MYELFSYSFLVSLSVVCDSLDSLDWITVILIRYKSLPFYRSISSIWSLLNSKCSRWKLKPYQIISTLYKQKQKTPTSTLKEKNSPTTLCWTDPRKDEHWEWESGFSTFMTSILGLTFLSESSKFHWDFLEAHLSLKKANQSSQADSKISTTPKGRVCPFDKKGRSTVNVVS